MPNKIYQVDSFCKGLFSGNPAAVCPLENWLEDQTMINIAAENNLAETTFYVKERDGFRIRWFTPEMEIDLCGHATLAAAHVLFFHEGFPGSTISFASCSGELKVTKKEDLLTLDFPADHIKQVEVSGDMLQWFSAAHRSVQRQIGLPACFQVGSRDRRHARESGGHRESEGLQRRDHH